MFDLIAAWRVRSNATAAVHSSQHPDITRRERYEAGGESRTFALCANELEAAMKSDPGAK